MAKPLVNRAKLVGAYRHRADLEHRGQPTTPADDRTAEIESALAPALIDEARRLADPSQYAPL